MAFYLLVSLQAVPLSARKTSAASAAGDGVSPFLQIPHFSENVVKKIGRKVNFQDCPFRASCVSYLEVSHGLLFTVLDGNFM